MKKIILIACSSKKLKHSAQVQDMYCSPLFKKSLAYAKSLKPNNIFILSAKYGLLNLYETIDPYNITLNNMTTKEIDNWSYHILHSLKTQFNLSTDEFIFLAGKNYTKFITPHITHFTIPMANLKIGKQLHFLTQQLLNFTEYITE